MDAILFIKKVKEICKNNACKDCPLWPDDERAFLNCTQFMLEAPEEIVEEVEKWAKKTPRRDTDEQIYKRTSKCGSGGI